jgi:hypothetical protein
MTCRFAKSCGFAVKRDYFGASISMPKANRKHRQIFANHGKEAAEARKTALRQLLSIQGREGKKKASYWIYNDLHMK